MLYNKLVDYKHQDIYPMHMPGHKRNSRLCQMVNPYEIDITEIDGFDNLHDAHEELLDLSDRAKRLFCAKESFLLVNGSTVGILATISASVNRGDTILIARNCHKSVYHAAMVLGLKTEYIYPDTIDTVSASITAEMVTKKLLQNKEVKAVIITSPTYEGVVSDVEKIAEAVHAHKAVLIVDEAHGAHLNFSEFFPESAVLKNADFVIQSLHKTLPCFTQTAILHSNRPEYHKKISFYLSIYESSSPSYLFLASMDQCFTMLETEGRALFKEYTDGLITLRESLASLKGLKLFSQNEKVYQLDLSKLVILTNPDNLNGFELSQRLLKDFRLQMEMSSCCYSLGMTSVCDTREGFQRFKKALITIDQGLPNFLKKSLKDCESNQKLRSDKIYEPYEVLEKEEEFMDLKISEGRVISDYICMYPPGSPVLVPGEAISKECIKRILFAKEMGLFVTGINRKGQIAVIKE